MLTDNCQRESLALTHQPYPAVWTYRGNDFRIIWEGRSPDSLTVKVTDIQTGFEIPYCTYHYINSWGLHDTLDNLLTANGWNFGRA